MAEAGRTVGTGSKYSRGHPRERGCDGEGDREPGGRCEQGSEGTAGICETDQKLHKWRPGVQGGGDGGLGVGGTQVT